MNKGIVFFSKKCVSKLSKSRMIQSCLRMRFKSTCFLKIIFSTLPVSLLRTSSKISKLYDERVVFEAKTFLSFLKACLTKLKGGYYTDGSQLAFYFAPSSNYGNEMFLEKSSFFSRYLLNEFTPKSAKCLCF